MKPNEDNLYTWAVARFDDEYEMWVNYGMGLSPTPEEAFQKALEWRGKEEKNV